MTHRDYMGNDRASSEWSAARTGDTALLAHLSIKMQIRTQDGRMVQQLCILLQILDV